MGRLSPKLVSAVVHSKCTEEQLLSAIESAGNRAQRQAASATSAVVATTVGSPDTDDVTRKRGGYRRRDSRPDDTRDITVADDNRNMTAESSE